MGENLKKLGTVETAKRLRKEYKKLFPKYKISVRSESYSGGSSINVNISNLDFNPINPEWIKKGKNHGIEMVSIFTDKYKKLLKKIESVGDKYHDYWGDGYEEGSANNFFFFVRLDYKEQDGWIKELEHGVKYNDFKKQKEIEKKNFNKQRINFEKEFKLMSLRDWKDKSYILKTEFGVSINEDTIIRVFKDGRMELLKMVGDKYGYKELYKKSTQKTLEDKGFTFTKEMYENLTKLKLKYRSSMTKKKVENIREVSSKKINDRLIIKKYSNGEYLIVTPERSTWKNEDELKNYLKKIKR